MELQSKEAEREKDAIKLSLEDLQGSKGVLESEISGLQKTIDSAKRSADSITYFIKSQILKIKIKMGESFSLKCQSLENGKI